MHLTCCVPKLLQTYFGSFNYGPPCIYMKESYLLEYKSFGIVIEEKINGIGNHFEDTLGDNSAAQYL